MSNVQLLRDAAREFYVDLPYHNFQHVLDTEIDSLKYADICEKNGLSPNRSVLSASALLHDANYYIDSRQFYKTKEEYSMAIAGHILPFFDYSSEDIEQTQIAINGTEAGQNCPTLEAKILRRADIGNVGSSPREFLTKTCLIVHENILLNGLNAVSWSDVVNVTNQKISSYLVDDDFKFGDFEESSGGQLKFIADCLKNIRRLPHCRPEWLDNLGHAGLKNFIKFD